MEFEKLKKKNPTYLPIPEKQGWVRGNKNIFKVGLMKSLFPFPSACNIESECHINLVMRKHAFKLMQINLYINQLMESVKSLLTAPQ